MRGCPGLIPGPADALDHHLIADGLEGTTVDIVLTDTPCGRTTNWAMAGAEDSDSILARMLSSLRPALQSGAIVVTVVRRGVQPQATDYPRV